MNNSIIRFGVQTGQQEASWATIKETWLELEELGFDDLWVYDHYLPTGTSLIGKDVTDGWTLLAALSQVVKKPRLGTLVTSATFRHPVSLAKIATTVDHLSDGRLILGLGSGWHEPEHKAYGIYFPKARERIERLEETVRIIKLLWSEQTANFNGKYFKLDNAPFEPKPIQQPHPRIVIGGGGEKRTLPLVARVADEWNWNINGTATDYAHKLQILKKACHDAGRDFHSLDLSINLDFLISENPKRIASALQVTAQDHGISINEARDLTFVGDPIDLQHKIQKFIDMGVTSFIFSLRAPFDELGTSNLPDIEKRTLRYHTTINDVRRLAMEVLPALRH